METDSSFVRTYSIVVLDAVAHIGMHISLIICPGHPKRENPIGNTEPLDQIAFFKLDIPIIGIFDGIQYLLLPGGIPGRWETAFSILSKRLLLS